jgi:membrane associated rhomboid family serine protease
MTMDRRVLKLSYNAPVTLTFSILALLALVLDYVTGGWTTTHLFSVYRCSLADPLAFFRFFGHVLGHAGFSHFMGNIIFILLLGPSVEDRFGSGSTLCAILVTAFVTGLVYFIFFPSSALLGASGTVYMMMLMASFGGAKNGVVPITTILVAVIYLGGELWNAIFQENDIAELAHVIGGVCGMLMGFALSGKRRGK